MTDLEKVEKLRERADVSFAEAKEALEHSGGEVLDALIYLESIGKATVPAGGGFFSGDGSAYHAEAEAQASQWQPGTGGGENRRGETFSEMMKRFGRFCLKVLNMGNSNFLDGVKGGNLMFSCPVTALVLLLIFFFWITVPLFVLSLFFGFRYRFRGADLGRDYVNRVMDSASDMVDDVKKNFAERGEKGYSEKENETEEI